MRILLKIRNSVDGVTGVPADVDLWGVLENGVLTCTVNAATFNALSPAQKKALLSTSQPATDTAWDLLDCSGSSDTLWVADTDDGADLIPDWATPLKYSYSNGTLVIESTSSIGQVKFERSDGTTFSVSNPDGVTINSSQFYGFGPLTGQGSFERQWAANLPINSYRITVKQDGGSDTYPYTFTPVAGASHLSLIP